MCQAEGIAGALLGAAVAVLLLAQALSGDTRASGSAVVSDDPWTAAHHQLAVTAADLATASSHGSLDEWFTLRARLGADCQTDAQLGGGSGTDHDAVVTYCQGIGVAVP